MKIHIATTSNIAPPTTLPVSIISPSSFLIFST
jgi:hypothetical protein